LFPLALPSPSSVAGVRDSIPLQPRASRPTSRSYPFPSEKDIDEDVVGEVRRLVARHPSFTVTFTGCGRFPDVLFLVPDPDHPFRALTTEVFGRWPDAPPYGGLITDPVPHLTITHGASPKDAAEAELDVRARLPFTCPIQQAWLIGFDGMRWNWWVSLPLGAAGPAEPARTYP
jgi:hypothetical protein